MRCTILSSSFTVLSALLLASLTGCNGDNPASGGQSVRNHGEWSLQNPYPCDAHLNDITMVGDDVWAVGDGGKIIHSADEGEHWEFQRTSTLENLRCVCFVDRQHGWAVGNNGTLLSTTNGGRYWQSEHFEFGNDFTSIAFRDQSTGWAVGRFGSLYTTNGGKKWNESTESGTAVYFVNSDVGYLFSNPGVKFYSSVANSWEAKGLVSYNYAMEDVAFLSVSDGIAIGYDEYEGNVYKALFVTHDSGATWSETWYPIQDGGADVAFDNQGVALVTDGYILLSSSDTGRNWNRHDFQTGTTVSRSLQFDQTGTGIIVGDNGRVHKSEDGGRNWREISNGFRTSQRDVCAIDPQTAWVLADDGVRVTHDSGQTWLLSLSLSWGTAMDFADSRHGCIVTESNGARVTMDGGNSWTPSSGLTNDYLQYVLLVDTLVGFAGSSQKTWRTADGGLFWASADSVGPFQCMYSTDNFHVWGVGIEYNPSLWRSDDGGANWRMVNEHIPAAYVMSAFFVDTLIGWVVTLYNGVQRTVDGGKTWTEQSTPAPYDLKDIAFSDAQVGWVTGWGGQLYLTEDGGNLWAQCDVATNQFIWAISIIDRFNGWAVGYGGTILHLH